MLKYFLPPYTPEHIEQQYKQLVKKLHPDKGGEQLHFVEMQTEKKAILSALSRLNIETIPKAAKPKIKQPGKTKPSKKEKFLVIHIPGVINIKLKKWS